MCCDKLLQMCIRIISYHEMDFITVGLYLN